MNTFTIEQATFMDRNLGTFEIPAGSFSFFLILTILIFTSLNERVFVPLARKITHTPHGITCLQRIGIGLAFSVIGMVASALVEKKRRDDFVQENVRITAFWLVPQFFLVGAGEAFAYVGQLEFFIREAPERMKSMSTGLFLSTLSMGYFVSSLLVSLVDKATKGKWLMSNLNRGRLDYFYWMLAVLGVLNLMVFVVFGMRHQYKVHNYVVNHDDGGREEELKEYDHEGIIARIDEDKKIVAIATEEP